jgi:hypothetical protein
MRGAGFASLVVLSGLLSGCGFMDWLSDDPDNLKLAALVREEVERADAERGKIRRDYIDQRIDKKIQTVGQNDQKLSDLESKISELGTRLDVVSRRAGTPELALSVDRPAGPTSEDFEKLRGDIQATIGALSDLIEDAGQRDAATNARFERLEYRTRTVEWPQQPADTGPGVHLASYKSHEAALRGWEVLLRKYASVLGGHEPALIEIETVAGRFVRLFVGGGFPESSLVTLRNQIRAGGDYAMIMPMPLTPGNGLGTAGRKPAPGS